MTNSKDIVKLDVPLFLRLLEHAREDANKSLTKAEAAEYTEIKKSIINEASNNIEVNSSNKKVENEKSEVTNPILQNKPLAIQVGAFTDHRNARTLTDRLSEFKAYIERIFIDNKYLYRVRIGPIDNINLAEELKEKLFNLGYTASHLIVN